MRRWNTFLSILLLCALLLGLCPGAGAAADGSDIIFLALNDAMPYSLASDTMPFWSDGVLYVHSTTFDITSLNLSASYNAGNMTLLLYNGATKRSLKFYLSLGSVQNQSGVTEDITVSMRGDQVFLPLEYCASFFGIGVSYLTSLEGWPLVRLTTGAQVWEDVLFIEKANNLINDRAAKYMASFNPPPVVQPDPPPVVTPDPPPVTKPEPITPSVPDEPDEPDPPPEDEPDEPVLPPEPVVQLTVYPALVGIEAVQSALPLLTEYRLAIYLDAEDILSNGDLVRQLYAAGHSIGLTGDPEAANDALDLVLCRRSLMALDMDDAAYLCHISTHDAQTLETATDDGPILLRLEDADAAEVLESLIEENATLLQLRETTPLFAPEDAPDIPQH